VRDATHAELFAKRTAEIVRELESLLGDVYELEAPDAPEWADFDPPGDDQWDGGKFFAEEHDEAGERSDEELAETVDSMAVDLRIARRCYDLGRFDVAATAGFYRARYEAALELCGKLRQYAQELHDKLDAVNGEAFDDHENVLAELSQRAKRLREDLGL
jgi:hypothetical protein